MERCSRGDTRGQEKGGGDGWTLNQEEIQGSRVTICSQHFMIVQVLSVKLNPSSPSTYEDNSKYLLHAPPWEGTFNSRKLFFILTKNRVCNGFSFFSSYRNRISQKTTENPAFRGASLKQPVQLRDTVTTAVSPRGASLANPDYFVI